MKTYMPGEDALVRKWYVIDAEGKTFGRLASRVASILRGKHKPEFTPHADMGDYVIVVNADKLHAIKGMLPKNSLGRQMIKKLKVYAGPNHNHEAQQPETLEV